MNRIGSVTDPADQTTVSSVIQVFKSHIKPYNYLQDGPNPITQAIHGVRWIISRWMLTDLHLQHKRREGITDELITLINHRDQLKKHLCSLAARCLIFDLAYVHFQLSAQSWYRMSPCYHIKEMHPRESHSLEHKGVPIPRAPCTCKSGGVLLFQCSCCGLGRWGYGHILMDLEQHFFFPFACL